VLDVTGHLLGANEQALDFRIPSGCEIGAAIGGDGQTGTSEQLQRGFL
jgi:hypothetical protein